MTASIDPAITVVMALTDHRGWTEAALATWDAQTYSRRNIALILLHDGREADVFESLRPLLHDQDTLACLPGLSEIALYDQGIRAAESEWVFISEPHVENDPQMLAEVLRLINDQALDGAACHSRGSRNNNHVARLEDAVFARDLATKGSSGHWNKVFLRGTCLRKSAYLDAGGLDARFGHFSEPLLGARLHQRGYQLGLVTSANTYHHSTYSLDTLINDQVSYGRDSMRYRLGERDPELDSYFGWCLKAPDYSCLPVQTAFIMLKAAAQQTISRSRIQDVLGVLRWTLRSRGLRYWLGLKLLLWRLTVPALRPVAGLQSAATAKMWRDGQTYGGLLEQFSLARHGCDRPSGRLQARDIGTHNSVGFFELEDARGQAFRWSTSCAALALPLRGGRYSLRVHLSRRRSYNADETLMLIIGGRSKAHGLQDGDSIELCVDFADAIRIEEYSCLYLMCHTQGSAERGGVDPRRLGVALESVSWQRLDEAANCSQPPCGSKTSST